MEHLKQCNHEGCEKEPAFTLHFALRPYQNCKPAMTEAIVALCPDHIDDVKFDDYMTETNWENICKGFNAAGLMAPVKKYCYLEINPIKK